MKVHSFTGAKNHNKNYEYSRILLLNTNLLIPSVKIFPLVTSNFKHGRLEMTLINAGLCLIFYLFLLLKDFHLLQAISNMGGWK